MVVRVQVRLEPQTYDRLRRIAAERGMRMSVLAGEMVRRAFREQPRRHQRRVGRTTRARNEHSQRRRTGDPKGTPG
jgi:predicted DNA-binding ribbon-helix-helix protein